MARQKGGRFRGRRRQRGKKQRGGFIGKKDVEAARKIAANNLMKLAKKLRPNQKGGSIPITPYFGRPFISRGLANSTGLNNRRPFRDYMYI